MFSICYKVSLLSRNRLEISRRNNIFVKRYVKKSYILLPFSDVYKKGRETPSPPPPRLPHPRLPRLVWSRGFSRLGGYLGSFQPSEGGPPPPPPLILSPKVNLSDNGGSHLCTYTVGPLKTSLNCLIWLATKHKNSLML